MEAILENLKQFSLKIEYVGEIISWIGRTVGDIPSYSEFVQKRNGTK
jgi:hypothetical protein